ARPDPDLEHPSPVAELRNQQRDRPPHRLLRDRARPVVVCGRGVEPNRVAHVARRYDFGMCLLGSTKGRLATVAVTRPRGVSASNGEPGASPRVGPPPPPRLRPT